MKKRFLGKEDGLLTLEACIALTIFIFLMLFLYSLFVVFEAQNEIAHALLATADSMALDTYSNEKLLNSNNITSAVSMVIYGIEDITGRSTDFVSHEMWNHVMKDEASNIWDGSIYASDAGAAEGGETNESGDPRYAVSSNLNSAIRERFLAYLSGSDLSKGNALLKDHLHIVNGLSGLDFSSSYISSGTLHLKVKYQIQFEFAVFGLGTLNTEQSCGSKLWQ